LVLCKEERELMALPMWISPYWEITIYALLWISGNVHGQQWIATKWLKNIEEKANLAFLRSC
jgi:hypothetical protein